MKSDGAVLATIGDTPLVELKNLDTGCCRLFVKLENQNPTGSIKDRIGLSMIEAAERSGELQPGGALIEATAGNTGLGLALVAAQKGYKLTLVIPDKMAQEKVLHLKALGARVIITRSDVGKGHPEYYQDVAERLAKETGAFYVNQFANPANPAAHEATTGPEIWSQTKQMLDAVVVGVGSGGTLTGLSRYFARVAPHVEMVLADPKGSILVDVVKTGSPQKLAGSWLVEGIGEDFIPSICDLSRVRAAYEVSDAESFATARELLAKEGLLGGSSTGTLVAAALRYCREQSTPKRVVTFVCDSGNKYLSKMYNDFWLFDQGILPRQKTGTIVDLIVRRYSDGSTVTLRPSDSLLHAYRRMKLFEVSQLPVMDGDAVIGILDESDLLMHVYENPARFAETVGHAMVKSVVTISPSAAVSELLPIFAKDMVAVVAEAGKFIGLITRIDLLNYLRLQLG
ncbi:MAG: pyridoxal-phosphate dependent enzyme [Myxococcales bacterium]|nr:pyridoxal-phosphate dependent enzyme [Myxococcales bacterium]